MKTNEELKKEIDFLKRNNKRLKKECNELYSLLIFSSIIYFVFVISLTILTIIFG